MHGFFGSYKAKVTWDLSGFDDKSFVKRTHSEGDFQLTQVTLPKFLNDKYFEAHDGCFIATEGVLFEADSAVEAIARYRNGESCFWDSWRGSFAGVFYDQAADTLLLFNDHIGSKMLFYAQVEGGFVFGSDIKCIAEAIGAKHYDEQFVESMLEKGCVEDGSTFLSGIHRLTAGQYMRVRGKNIEVCAYHRFDNTPREYDEAEMLKETDRLFRQAVERVVRKNEREGWQQYYPLSGGLDSRMTQWIARQIATKPIVNYTYSQSGHYDHLLPKEISKTLGNEWQFYPLDGGAYITNVDSVCAQTEWLINYMAPIEIAIFAQEQDWTHVGVVLTGVNGDNILATETDNAHEMARIYIQGFNGNSLGSPLVLQHYTESYSPFCDVDVLDYVLHVPTIKRRNYYFYDQWILGYYPEAAQWHHKHAFIGQRPKMVTIAGRNIPLRDVPKRLLLTTLKRLHIYDGYRMDADSMNPYDRWIKENSQILLTLENYYNTNKSFVRNDKLLSACAYRMHMGPTMEKGKALTVLCALKSFYHTDGPAIKTTPTE